MPKPKLKNDTARRKRRKLEKQQAQVTGKWDKCMFFVTKKQRYCNMSRMPSSEYCGNHHYSSSKSTQAKERMPCPLDSSHSIYVDQLDKHLKICNKQQALKELQQAPYYAPNINSGTPSSSSTRPETTLLQQLLAIDFQAFQKRIEDLYMEHIKSIPVEILQHQSAELQQFIDSRQQDGCQHKTMRHNRQQSSILAHLDKLNLLQSSNVYFELGSGRGMLSLALVHCLPQAKIILIDRGTSRGKADRLINEADAQCSRLQLDLRDLKFQEIPQLSPASPIVCYSKHLCGVATDLSLRGLTTTLTNPLQGIVIALCCHHACSWDDYINQDFILQQGLTPGDFHLLVGISTWATCGLDKSAHHQNVGEKLGISVQDRMKLGRQCKRILDIGRANYLQAKGLNARLVEYCSREDSLENCLLIASRSTT